MTRTPDSVPSTDLIAEAERYCGAKFDNSAYEASLMRRFITALRAAGAREQKLREALTHIAEYPTEKFVMMGAFAFGELRNIARRSLGGINENL